MFSDYKDNNKFSNKNKNEKFGYNNKKIVLNTKNDLINIPTQQLRTAQLKNFCGTLFEQLYQEALAIEYNQKNESQNKNNSHEINFNNSQGNIIRIKKKPITYSKSISTNINQKIFNGEKSAEKSKKIKIIKKVIKPNLSLNKSDLNLKSNSSLQNDDSIIKSKGSSKKNINRNLNNTFTDYNIIQINKIFFSIKYNTTFGEEIGVLGSIPKLGNWSQNQIFYLNWNNGNIWTGEIPVESPPIDFEFKFIIAFNRYIKKWESGENNKVNFEQLINEIKYKKNGFYNKYEYKFDEIKDELYLICKWQ